MGDMTDLVYLYFIYDVSCIFTFSRLLNIERYYYIAFHRSL